MSFGLQQRSDGRGGWELRGTPSAHWSASLALAIVMMANRARDDARSMAGARRLLAREWEAMHAPRRPVPCGVGQILAMAAALGAT